MKKMKFSRWLSLLLILSFLLSFGLVYVGAEETDEDEDEDEPAVELIYHRTYDEGWNYTNGVSDTRKENNYFIDYEITSSYDYNYFWRMEVTNAQDGYAELAVTSVTTGATVIAFDAMSDDYANVGTIYYRSSDNVAPNVFAIKNGAATLYGMNMGPVDENWRHYVLILDWDTMTATASVEGPGLTNASGASVTRLEQSKAIEHQKGIQFFRIGQSAGSTVGLSWCLDNLTVHNGPKRELTDEEIENYGPGKNVNTEAAKTIAILGSGNKAQDDYFKKMLCMKVGVDYALLNQKRVQIFDDGKYGAPVEIDGTIYVPLDIILTYIGYPYYIHPDGLSYDISTGTSATYLSVGRETAVVSGKTVDLNAAPCFIKQTVNGEEKSFLAIAMDDVELLFADEDHPDTSIYVTYDKMGLIIICGKDDIINRTTGLTEMMDLMKAFVFDNPSADTFYEDVKAFTNNFRHPYILTNQDRFDELKAIYDAKTPADPNYNSPLRTPLQNLVRVATKAYEQWAYLDEEGNYISLKPDRIANGDLLNPNDVLGNYGYDPAGGRLNESASRMTQLQNWAFAYQITRDIKFAYVAYDYAIEMGKWDHWGPAHFLNCADATSPIAIAFDWLYNAFVEIAKTDSTRTPEKIADIIYSHGVYQGYNAVVNNACDWPNSITKSFRYDNFTNNWNAVCTSGMVIGALSILQYDQYRVQASKMTELSLFALGDHGLGQYAPDGSYIESPGYWSYGTNTFFRLCAALESAAGTDYGLMDCWGIDTTCYFAVQSESSDYLMWNYHDGGEGSQDGSWFMYAGTHFGDNNLCAVRAHQLANGKSYTQYDIIFYNEDASQGKPQMELAYYMEGIQAYTVRSSWEKQAIFTGIMGGEGNVAHGNIDNGNFIYDNLGTRWIKDLGGDQYNVYGYFSTTYRYRYYRLGTEGSNVMLLTSEQANMPYGQHLNEDTVITKHYENDYGGYAILDNLPAFRNYVMQAERGIMLTNNRKTVVVQDEVVFGKVEEVYWFAHTLKSLNPEISADGQTAYLSRLVNGSRQVIRLSLVTKIRGLKFEEMSVYDYVLDTTFRTELNETVEVYGKSPEYNRSQYTKFAIHGENVLNFNVAVVIEEVDKVNSTQEVGYEWTPMAKWEPYESMNSGNTPDPDNPTDPDADTDYDDMKNKTYTRADMLDAMDIFYELDEEQKVFTSQIKDGYLALYTSYRVMENNPTMTGKRYQEALERYNTYKAKYDEHLANVNATQKTIRDVGYALMGISE